MYSEMVVELGMNPKNLGEIDNADGFGRVTGPCGDTMSIWLKIGGDRILDAGFTTDGCTTSLASASMVTLIAKGSRLEDAQKISQQDVLDALGGLPDESRHCALLAANTLKAAIEDYLEQKENTE
ncbi:MAG: iron-sulfur cluster assembly scaffold protein [Acidobacteria bacterium]|nr:iron-sulfur cluster assembly scaffold protein [Acidobacteriota bacterium]